MLFVVLSSILLAVQDYYFWYMIYVVEHVQCYLYIKTSLLVVFFSCFFICNTEIWILLKQHI